MTRFLCVGDLHLGAGADYGREPGDRLRDQEAVWSAALELAAEHDVDAVLFAGDAFHRRRPTPAEMIAFQRPLQRFTAEHDIEVVAVAGNHDCEAADLPTALDVFGREVDLFVQPGVWLAPDGGAAVACLPWTPTSRLVAARGGGDREVLDGEAAGLLVATLRGLRAQIPAGQPAVALLHWSISGASTPTGVMTDEFREVVLDVDELHSLGFDAIVAGHIHKAQSIGFGSPIFYAGSPAPVDFGEAAVEHGCYLLEIDHGPAHGDVTTTVTFLPIESRRFVTLDFDLADEFDEHTLAAASGFVSDTVVDAVVRLRYTGTEEQARRIDHAALSRELYACGASKVFAIQPTIEREDRARVDGVDEDLAPLAALDAWVIANEISTEDSAALVDLTSGYLEAVGT